jgi:hypothetical protein
MTQTSLMIQLNDENFTTGFQSLKLYGRLLYDQFKIKACLLVDQLDHEIVTHDAISIFHDHDIASRRLGNRFFATVL